MSMQKSSLDATCEEGENNESSVAENECFGEVVVCGVV
jgi:hypothetical protein